MQVGVVRDVGRRGAPVDDAARRGRRRAEDAHVRHDVVPRRAALPSPPPRSRCRRGARRICAIASSGIGRPSRRSSSASQSQRRRQVSNLNWAEKMRRHLGRGVALGEGVAGPVSPGHCRRLLPRRNCVGLVVAADQALGLRDPRALHLEDVGGRRAGLADEVVDLAVLGGIGLRGPLSLHARHFRTDPGSFPSARTSSVPARGDNVWHEHLVAGIRLGVRPPRRSRRSPRGDRRARAARRDRGSVGAARTACSRSRPRAAGRRGVDRRFEEMRRSVEARVQGVEQRAGGRPEEPSPTTSASRAGSSRTSARRWAASTRRRSKIEKLAGEVTRLEDLLKPPKLRGTLGETFLEQALAQVLPPRCWKMQYRFGDAVVDAAIFVGETDRAVDSKFPLGELPPVARGGRGGGATPRAARLRRGRPPARRGDPPHATSGRTPARATSRSCTCRPRPSTARSQREDGEAVARGLRRRAARHPGLAAPPLRVPLDGRDGAEGPRAPAERARDRREARGARRGSGARSRSRSASSARIWRTRRSSTSRDSRALDRFAAAPRRRRAIAPRRSSTDRGARAAAAAAL